jgi:hypothetical protein
MPKLVSGPLRTMPLFTVTVNLAVSAALAGVTGTIEVKKINKKVKQANRFMALLPKRFALTV